MNPELKRRIEALIEVKEWATPEEWRLIEMMELQLRVWQVQVDVACGRRKLAKAAPKGAGYTRTAGEQRSREAAKQRAARARARKCLT